MVELLKDNVRGDESRRPLPLAGGEHSLEWG
jgi:hypothetical protein